MNPTGLKDLYERKARAVARRPALARGRGQVRVWLGDGLCCDVEHDDGRIRVDQPESEGGTGTSPHPGHLMRASVGACLAMGYRIWGARFGVAIDRVEMEVTCDFDARGQMGVSSAVAVGWQSVRFDVTIVSDAPESDIRRVVETADRLSPMLANLSPSVSRIHRLTIRRGSDPEARTSYTPARSEAREP